MLYFCEECGTFITEVPEEENGTTFVICAPCYEAQDETEDLEFLHDSEDYERMIDHYDNYSLWSDNA